MSTTKTSLIVKEILARLAGNNDEALAIRIARKSISAIEGQIAALKSKQIDDESKVEDAEEALGNAKFPTVMPTENQSYIAGIAVAHARAENAKESLASTTDSIEFFENLLKELKTQK